MRNMRMFDRLAVLAVVISCMALVDMITVATGSAWPLYALFFGAFCILLYNLKDIRQQGGW